MIIYKTGDMFDSTADAYMHGCNTLGKMNAGIAKQFRQRFPLMFRDYKERCRKGLFLPGQGYVFYNEQKPHVINIATQNKFNAETQYVEDSLRWVFDNFPNMNISSIAAPRIAAGLGGLEWESVKNIVEDIFHRSRLRLEIWTLD